MTAFPDAPVTTALTLALTVALYLGGLAFAGTTVFEASIARRRVAGLRGVTVAAGVLAVAAATLLLPFGALSILLLEPPALLRPELWAPAVLWPQLAVALATWGGVAGALALTPPSGAAGGGATIFAGVVAAAPVLTGHSWTLQPAVLRLVDAVHLLAASVWAGGLLGLLVLLLPRRGDALPGDPVEAAGVLERFSGWALGTVVLLATSGLVVATASIGTLDALLGTPWGRALSTKLGLVALTVALAALNRFRAVPAIRRRGSDAVAWSMLRRLAAAEAVLLTCVVVVTGVLTSTDSGLHAGH